jgi:hypothetical protein
VLNSIAGLRSGTLSSVGNLFFIAGNPLLSACEVNTLRTALGVTGNDQSGANSGCTTCAGTTCSAGAGGITGQSGAFVGDVTVANATDLAWMKNITDIQGFLHINSTPLTSITGLTNLKTISKEMTINSNAALTSLSSLTGLTSVGGFVEINSNGSSSGSFNINGLSAVTSIGKYLEINSNTGMANVGTGALGLVKLATVGGYVTINYNASLTNLDGLVGLTSIGTTTNDQLQIYSNAALVSILGLLKPTAGTGKLNTLLGNLDIRYNGNLPQCHADALKNQLTAAGWARTYTTGSNFACASPKTCVGTVCQ